MTQYKQKGHFLCQEQAVLLVVQLQCQWLGDTAAMPMVAGSTFALPTFFCFFSFFQAPLRCYLYGLVFLG